MLIAGNPGKGLMTFWYLWRKQTGKFVREERSVKRPLFERETSWEWVRLQEK